MKIRKKRGKEGKGREKRENWGRKQIKRGESERKATCTPIYWKRRVKIRKKKGERGKESGK